MRLRATTPADLAFVRTVESAPENAEYVEQWPLEAHRHCLEAPDCSHWILESGAEHRAVGYAILQGLERPDGRVLLRRIAIAGKGRGFGRAAVRALARYAFERRGAACLWLSVLPANRRALRLYHSLGFVDEEPEADGEPGQARVLRLDRAAYERGGHQPPAGEA